MATDEIVITKVITIKNPLSFWPPMQAIPTEFYTEETWELPEEERGNGICDDVEIDHEDGVDPSRRINFNNHKDGLGSLISSKDFHVSGTVNIGGTDYTVVVNSAHFGPYLQNYNMRWNSSANIEGAALGASYDGFAIVDPSWLNNGVSNINVWSWIAMHESLHQYSIAAGVNKAYENVYRARTGLGPDDLLDSGWTGSAEWQMIEKINNDVLIAVARAAGIPMNEDNLPGGKGAMETTETSGQDTSLPAEKQPNGVEHEYPFCS